MDLKKYEERQEYIEIYKRNYISESYYYKNAEIENIKAAQDNGIGVRILSNNRQGTAFSNSIDIDLDTLIEQASQNLQYSEEESFVPEIRDIDEKNEVENTPISREDITRIGDLLQKNIKNNVSIPKAAIARTYYNISICNNRGVELSDKGQFFSFSVYAKSQKNDIMESGYDYFASKDKNKIQYEKIISNAIEEAEKMLEASTLDIQLPLFLDNRVAASFLDLIAMSFSAENYIKGKSIFKGNEDEKYCKELNIIDDGTMLDGIATSIFDGEGTKRSKTILMKSGKLNSFLHNTSTSKKMNKENTGNASRVSLSEISIDSTNLYIDRGNEDFDSILNNTGKLFFVKNVMGLHTSNIITGDFSVGASGYLYENGAYKPVRGVTINGNLKEMLKKISKISDDLVFYGGTGSPKLLVEGIKITGN